MTSSTFPEATDEPTALPTNSQPASSALRACSASLKSHRVASRPPTRPVRHLPPGSFSPTSLNSPVDWPAFFHASMTCSGGGS